MPNKIYAAPETKVSIKGSGGDVTLTFASTPDQAIAVSAQRDFGSGSKPRRYRWTCKTQMNATGTVGRQMRLYWVETETSADVPGRLGTSDAEYTTASDRTRNLGTPFGVVNADTTASATDLIASGEMIVTHRYGSLAIFNDFGVALHATEGNHYFEMVPIPDEIQ